MLRTNRWGCSNIPDYRLLLRRGKIPAPPAGTPVGSQLQLLLLEAREAWLSMGQAVFLSWSWAWSWT